MVRAPLLAIAAFQARFGFLDRSRESPAEKALRRKALVKAAQVHHRRDGDFLGAGLAVLAAPAKTRAQLGADALDPLDREGRYWMVEVGDLP